MTNSTFRSPATTRGVRNPRALMPVDARVAPVPAWTPVAPWSARSVPADEGGIPLGAGFWGPAFILMFQLTMVWLLLTSL